MPESTKGITLSRHILEQEEEHAEMRGELSALLAQIGLVATILAREMRRAALVGKLGLIGDQNPTGDPQKKLDVFANQVFVDAFKESGLVAAIVSEELEEVKEISCREEARYILSTDPLDGSSNTDINGALGTIFGIYRRIRTGHCAGSQEILRRGSELAAAGYVLFSTSVVLVYSCRRGVNGFTLDHDIGEFLLSHDNISCPVRGNIFSANVGRLRDWPSNLQAYVEYLTQNDAATRRPYSLRYSGALVADVHRCLLEGGLYFYPADSGHRDGKLRLIYECIPLAYLTEGAGGRASTGKQRILDLQPESIHQRTPLVIGSREDVTLYERFMARGEC
ncbi:MAG: class 1 fructose-bisphosphatase [Acidobacteria bacterium]|nr:class 1 fructose-bisphosphatase [Acidobacteriota bacterium]